MRVVLGLLSCVVAARWLRWLWQEQADTGLPGQRRAGRGIIIALVVVLLLAVVFQWH